MIKRIVLFSMLIAGYLVEAKILIFTYAYNRPDFIEIQHKTFKKFLKDEYEFVVFSDARNNSMHQHIEKICSDCKLRCIRIPQEIHNRPYLNRLPGENYNAPAIRNCNVVQYSLNEYGFDHDDILLLMDSDCFLIKEFSIRDFMKGYTLAGCPQYMGYLWIGLVFLDLNSMPNKRTINFNCGKVDGKSVDAGGHTYEYIRDNLGIKVNYFSIYYPQEELRNDTKSLQSNFRKIDISFIQSGVHNIEYFIDNTFLHYRGGTNWDNKSSGYHKQKTNQLNDYIEALLNI